VAYYKPVLPTRSAKRRRTRSSLVCRISSTNRLCSMH